TAKFHPKVTGKLTVHRGTNDPSLGMSLGGSRNFKSLLNHFFGILPPPDQFYKFQELSSTLQGL
ncbi:hypothetical protein HAX54_047292, partial [Datura stramonium]|nr:hypothetical protein [Datura stramonium]